MKPRALPQVLLATACLTLAASMAYPAPTRLVEQAPASITQPVPGAWLIDFGRVAFGNLQLRCPPELAGRELTVRFGEDFTGGQINRQPPGTVRYAEVKVIAGEGAVIVAPPPDIRNTWTPGRTDFNAFKGQPLAPKDPPPPAILTPAEWGVLTPFRWIEIEGWPGDLPMSAISRRAAFPAQWDDQAAEFTCSNERLNQVWELCRYSIKATAFAGIYVDGDRERIPYEGDAYLNQLSDYAVNGATQMARDTFDHLLAHGTWPTEWAYHMVFMAHADWWRTADRAWLETRYPALRAKLLLERVGPDGLVTSTPEQIAKGDIVDWPKGERDGFVFTSVNSVINSFYLRALEMMIEMGRALGRDREVAEYTAYYEQGLAAYRAKFFIPDTGLYRDGRDTEHSSLHANVFALGFGLIPASQRPALVRWLQSRGMNCSVYVAQYYLQALFQNGAGPRGIELILAPGDRSWHHMLARGATITWEAWDAKYKPNLDWNHAWGAAPANLLPRFVLGVEAAVPGWSRARIAPDPSGLAWARGRVPTPLGAIEVDWRDGETFQCTLDLPAGLQAEISLPAGQRSLGVFRHGSPVPARLQGNYWKLDAPLSGRASFEVR